MINAAVKKRIMPFLNKYITPETAEKAINKISPKIGSFLKKGVSQGLPLAGGLNFLREQFGGEEEPINQSLRPDERAAIKEQRREKNIGSTIKNVGKFGLTAAASLPIGRALATGIQAIDALLPEESEQEQQEKNTIPEIKAIEDKNSQIQNLYDLAKAGKTQGVEFLKYASQLIKSGDIGDYETFSNFWKWWTAKPSKKRGSPRAEFELFRNEIGNTLQQSKAALQQEVMNPPGSLPQTPPTAEMQAAQNQSNPQSGDEALLAAFQKIMQM